MDEERVFVEDWAIQIGSVWWLVALVVVIVCAVVAVKFWSPSH